MFKNISDTLLLDSLRYIKISSTESIWRHAAWATPIKIWYKAAQLKRGPSEQYRGANLYGIINNPVYLSVHLRM